MTVIQGMTFQQWWNQQRFPVGTTEEQARFAKDVAKRAWNDCIESRQEQDELNAWHGAN